MGSTDKAVITGFICRLCSKMNRFVIHIYGEEGERMKLAEKINAYLPITVKMNDPLPKTACLHCIERLEAHHELMEKIIIARKRLGMESDINQVSSSRSSPTIAVQTTTTTTTASAATTATPLSPPSLIPSRAPPSTTTIAVNTPPGSIHSASLSVDTPSSTSTPLC